MSKHVVILGGGVGGTMVANHIARTIPEEIKSGDVKVTLLSNDQKHIYQPGYLFVSFNEAHMSQFERKEKTLLSPGINLVIDNIVKIDKQAKKVFGDKGTVYAYDYLVISTGSVPTFDTIPGLAEDSHNFYTREGALKLRDALANFTEGKIVVTVDVPHKCPAAPLEMSLMLDDYFRVRGLRDKVDITYTYPISRVHALQSVAEWAAPEFERRGINAETFFNLETIDTEKKLVISMEGTELPYDLLISIPTHRGSKVIIDSGLGDENGFIPTDRHSLKMIGDDFIYVLGDATNLPISKAGSTAHYQTETVVHNVISELHGLPPRAHYDGKVVCFLESKMDEASFIEFTYNKPPQPAVPSEMLYWFKLAYNEMYWLFARGLL